MIRNAHATFFLTIAVGVLAGFGTRVARADDTVIQIPLPGLLDARSVTTLTAGKLVTWTLPTDGGGLQNAFATVAVATAQNAPVANALPDDGHFAANARHPDVVLHFSNAADAASPQTHLVAVGGSFEFMVPAATYSKLFLFFNGAAGGTTVKATFTYTDGTDSQSATIPDYYADIMASDPVIFNLATNLAKWDKTTKIAEANHHNITGAELHPAASKTLTSVQVERGPNGYLVFWGATGIATSPIAGSGGAGGMPGAAGATGAAGSAGLGGSAGTSGAAAAGGAQAAGGAGGAGAAGMSAGAGTGGTSGAGTAGASAAAGATTTGTSGGTFVLPTASDSGCSCRMTDAPGRSSGAPWLALGALSAWCFARRRRHVRDR
jgi:MYXO-CTERM domain-containing protein